MSENRSKIYTQLEGVIANLEVATISEERKRVLQPLVEYIQKKKKGNAPVLLNFVCTHNSRRSHLSQIWAQTMATYFNVNEVYCFSGGTEVTAVYPMLVNTLKKSGFRIAVISEGKNPVYSIKYADNELPVIGFSKTFDNDFNPKSDFATIMTCSHASENCPIILGAEERIPITYEDPKEYDGTSLQEEKYLERSLQIAAEMYYVFSACK